MSDLAIAAPRPSPPSTPAAGPLGPGRPATRDPDGDGTAALLHQLLRELGVPEADLGEPQLIAALGVLRYLTDGYRRRPEEVTGEVIRGKDRSEPVVVRSIPFVSMDQEHLLPFSGSVDVAYLPGSAFIGLPKLDRLVGAFAHRLQTPARLAEEVATALSSDLAARGSVVRVQAHPLYPQPSTTIEATAYVGAFRLPLWRERVGVLLG